MQFFFQQGGVNAFSVAGIETSAGLDPNNAAAFVTGLTFVGSGPFSAPFRSGVLGIFASGGGAQRTFHTRRTRSE